MTQETIHGCTCKPKWTIATKKKFGGTFEGCAYGSGTKKCPFVQDKKNLAKGCDKDIPSFCIVQEKCGSNKAANGDILPEYWDYCDWPQLELGDEWVINNKKKYILGLIIYLASFGIVIPTYFIQIKMV